MSPALLASLVALFATGNRLDVRVGAGVQTNPFEIADAASAASPALVVPVSMDARVQSTGTNFRVGVTGWAEAAFHPTAAAGGSASGAPPRSADADRWSLSAAVPIVCGELSKDAGLQAVFEPFVEGHRETFTSHRTGLPYVYLAPGATTGIDLGRRLDTNTVGARSHLQVGTGDVGALLGVEARHVDYVEDYRSDPGIDRWDYDEGHADLQLLATPGRWALSVRGRFSLRQYSDRFPHRTDGTFVKPADSGYRPQVFQFHELSLRAARRWNRAHASARYDAVQRIDTYASYLSYLEHRITLDATVPLGLALAARFRPTIVRRTYDRAHVSYDPAAPTSEFLRLEAKATAEWTFSRRHNLFVEGSLVRQDSSNPLYSFSDARFVTGVHVEWR
jgi:hypothetical protein